VTRAVSILNWARFSDRTHDYWLAKIYRSFRKKTVTKSENFAVTLLLTFNHIFHMILCTVYLNCVFKLNGRVEK